MFSAFRYLCNITWQYAQGRRHILVLTYIMFVISNTIMMTEPYILALFLNTLQQGGDDMLWWLIVYLSLFIVVNFVFWLFHGPARVLERSSSYYIQEKFLNDMYIKTTALPLKWHRDNHSGRTYDKINKSWSALARFTSDSFELATVAVRSTIAVAVILYFVPLYGSIAVAIGGVAILIIQRFDKILIANRKKINANDHTITSALFDYVSNITTVITLRLEDLSRREVIRRFLKIKPVYDNNIRVNEWKWFVVTMIVVSLQFFVLLMYILEALSLEEALLIGSVVALFQYVQRFTDSFFSIAWMAEDLVWQATDLRLSEDIKQAYDDLVVDKAAVVVPSHWNSLSIEGVHFRYEDAKHRLHHIDNINLQVQRGQTIALVGASGSGKSTLMYLLRGLEQPDEGVLRVDGEVVTFETLSEITTLVPQEPEIFENTIEYNITAGIEHDQSELLQASALANFTAVVDRLENGYQSSIKEKGVNLSGGEKQRLALARGVFAAKNSSLILLDEPTSSVDSANEKEIYQQLMKHFADKAIISSVHRLHLLPLFDRVYVLDDGKVIESGTFDELTSDSDGLLTALWESYQEDSA